MTTCTRKFPVAWPLAICLLLPTLTRGETTVQAWAQRYHGPGSGTDSAVAVATDSSNSVIVTGYSDGGGSTYDYATIKYSSAGAPLWTNRYNGPANTVDIAQAVTLDSSNNVIVTGYSAGVDSYYDYATVLYSSTGVPVWTNRYNGPGNDYDEATAVAVDASNNVIVSGYSTGSGSLADYATIMYSSAGVPLWTNRYNGPGNGFDEVTAVAVDGSNNIIVTGSSYGSGSSYDYATIKYSKAGAPLWTNRYNGPGNYDDQARGLVIDGSNNVIVAGYSIGNGSYYDYATIKYSSAGVPLWTNRYNGPGKTNDYAFAVAVDGSNNVVVTGYSTGTGGYYDYATIKYSSAGVPLWTNRYSGPAPGNNYAYAVGVDSSNNVYVTGGAAGSGSAYDYATIKYSSAGAPIWTNRYTAPGNGGEGASALVADHGGSVLVTGSSGSDYATVKYLLFTPPVLSGLNWTNGAFQMRVDNVLQPGTLVIEASTGLASWAPVFTNTTPTNVLFYTDLQSVGFPRRFYRAFQSP